MPSPSTVPARPGIRSRLAPPLPVIHVDARPGIADRIIAAVGHLGLCVFPVAVAAILYASTGRRSGFVRRHTAEAVNVQLSLVFPFACLLGLLSVWQMAETAQVVVAGTAALLLFGALTTVGMVIVACLSAVPLASLVGAALALAGRDFHPVVRIRLLDEHGIAVPAVAP